MAAQFAFENPGKLKGIFLLGTSNPKDFNMSDQHIPTLKLYAEHDGLASVDEVMENRELLPSQSSLIMIKGGNHSQFGFLGKLFLDDDATITRDQQQAEILKHLLLFFEGIDEVPFSCNGR